MNSQGNPSCDVQVWAFIPMRKKIVLDFKLVQRSSIVANRKENTFPNNTSLYVKILPDLPY